MMYDKKIAVLRANGLGDFIFSLPAFQALREAYPKAEIVLFAKKWHKDFLSDRKSPINRVISIPDMPGVGKPNDYKPNIGEISYFFQTTKQEKFDIAVQMHGGGKYSNHFVRNIGAKLSIGFQTPEAIGLDKTLPYIYYQNEYLRYLELVQQIGAKVSTTAPHFDVMPQDIQELRSCFPADNPYAVLHPGASDIRRRWEVKKFAKAGDYLASKGLQVVVTGVEEEQLLVEELIARMKYPAVDLCNKLTLSGLTGLLSQATLVVSNDSGPFHLAFALHTPVIGLFWCGNMINGAPANRRITRPLISWITRCPLCNGDCTSVFPFQPQKDCSHEVSFLSGISIREVMKTIDELLTVKNDSFYMETHSLVQDRFTRTNNVLSKE